MYANTTDCKVIALVVMVVLAVELAVEAVAVCTTVIVAEYSGTVRGENGTGSGRSAGSNATIGPEVSAAELRKSRVQRSCAYVEEHQVKQRSCWCRMVNTGEYR